MSSQLSSLQPLVQACMLLGFHNHQQRIVGKACRGKAGKMCFHKHFLFVLIDTLIILFSQFTLAKGLILKEVLKKNDSLVSSKPFEGYRSCLIQLLWGSHHSCCNKDMQVSVSGFPDYPQWNLTQNVFLNKTCIKDNNTAETLKCLSEKWMWIFFFSYSDLRLSRTRLLELFTDLSCTPEMMKNSTDTYFSLLKGKWASHFVSLFSRFFQKPLNLWHWGFKT